MAEKTSTKKRPARQQMLEALTQTEKEVSERREAQARPEEKVESRAVAGAVAVADELSARGVVQSIGELKSSVGRMLGELSDKLEEQVGWLMATLMPLRGPLPTIRVPPSSSSAA